MSWKRIYAFFSPQRFFRAFVIMSTGQKLEFLEFEDGDKNYKPSGLKNKSFRKGKAYLQGNIVTYFFHEDKADSLSFEDLKACKTPEEWDNDLAVEQLGFWDEGMTADRIMLIVIIGISLVSVVISAIAVNKVMAIEKVVGAIASVVIPR